MLSNNDIRIVYLEYLQREPTDMELAYSQSNFNLDSELEDYLKKSTEYKIEFLKPSQFDFEYQDDIITVPIVNDNLKDGKLLSNNKVGFITSGLYHKFTKIYIYDNNHRQINVTNFMNIRFKSFTSNDTYLPTYNNSQKLFMNECRFQDSFNLNINASSIDVKIDKYPLFTNKSCILQKITLSTTSNTELSLIHKLDGTSDMNTGIMTMKNGKSFNYYEHYLDTSDIRIVTITNSTNSSLSHIGVFDDVDGSLNDIYNLNLEDSSETVLYVLTSITQNDRIMNREIINNSTYYSFEEIIESHKENWMNIWKTNLTIHPKSSLPLSEKSKINEINAINKSVLFDLFCDPFETNIDLDLLGLPILILLKPELAKKALENRSYSIDFDNNVAIDTNKTLFIQNDRMHYMIKLALLSIHHWNYFRVTKDNNWLSNVGFSFMEKCYKVLINHDFTSNTLYNYLIEQSLYFTNQAIYELNFRYEIQLPSFNLPYFDDSRLFAPTSTVIKIRLEKYNDLLNICFYNEDNTLIGYQFGGSSGYKLSLIENTNYKFKLEYDQTKYHIRFIIYASTTGTRFRVEDIVYNTIDQYDNFIDPDPNSDELEINSNSLIGYLFIFDEVYEVFKQDVNTDFGQYAFITHSVNNIIKPTVDYTFEVLNSVNTYLIFNSYYNSSFYRSVENNNIVSFKSEFIDKIDDNVTFYNKHRLHDDNFTNILEAGLESIIGHYKYTYKQKHNRTKVFYYKLLKSLENTFNNHWFQGELSSELLFIMLTNVFELTPWGEIQKHRMKVNDFALFYLIKNTLPEEWKDVSGYNIGIENENILINNRIFFEDPFYNFPELTEYNITHDELNSEIIMNLDFSESFPNGLPNNFNYYLYIQDQNDDRDYKLEENTPLLLGLATSASVLNESSITISYTPITDIIESDSNIPIQEIQNRIVHFIYDINASEFKFKTFYLNNLPNLVSNINPTIHGTISYENPLTLKLDIFYNSLNQYEYQSFSNISFTINYDHLYFANISYHDDDILFVSSSNYVDSNNIFSADIETSSNIVTSHYNLGTLLFEMNENAVINNYTDSLKNVFVSDDIVISNSDIFPPGVQRRKLPIEFLYPPYVIGNNLNETEINTIIYHPITNLYKYETNSLNTYTSSLFNNDNTLINVLSSESSTIFVIKTSTNSIEYYAIGNNENNMLMTNKNSNYLTTPEKCVALENTIDGNEITDVYTTSKFSLVKTSVGKLYGIGNNEKYNLGDLTNVNRTSFVECTVLNSLVNMSANGPFTNVVLNETCVLVQFGNRTLYALGELEPLFNYQLPQPLSEINTFLLTNGYNIKRIETGKQHFKFLLEKVSTGNLEWWGIGRNVYHNMCIDYKVDNDYDILYIQRLHDLERLINGRKYDIEYTGYKITNPKKYHFVTTHGLPSLCTLIFDEVTKKIYKLGTFDEENISNQWEEIDVGVNYDIKFLSLCENTFVIGN